MLLVFVCYVICRSERSEYISIINNVRIELMCESGGELRVCVCWLGRGGESHRETSFVFGQKRYTMGLDTFECIQKG
jgi:hypothetical protein